MSRPVKKSNEIPHRYTCPITKGPLFDPVYVNGDRHRAYNRDAITLWYMENKNDRGYWKLPVKGIHTNRFELTEAPALKREVMAYAAKLSGGDAELQEHLEQNQDNREIKERLAVIQQEQNQFSHIAFGWLQGFRLIFQDATSTATRAVATGGGFAAGALAGLRSQAMNSIGAAFDQLEAAVEAANREIEEMEFPPPENGSDGKSDDEDDESSSDPPLGKWARVKRQSKKAILTAAKKIMEWIKWFAKKMINLIESIWKFLTSRVVKVGVSAMGGAATGGGFGMLVAGPPGAAVGGAIGFLLCGAVAWWWTDSKKKV